MYKRGLAFLLAAVLAFSPVMQVGATGVNAQEIPVETPEEVETTEVTEGPEIEETEAPEESAAPTAPSTEAPEETPATSETPEVTPAESEMPEETALPEEMPETSIEPAVTPFETPEASAEIEAEIMSDTEQVSVLTDDIEISEEMSDRSGEGWTWVASTKTFTMNGYHSTGKLTLPDGAKIILAAGSENSINTAGTRKNCIFVLGSLTIEGSGKLTCINGSEDSVSIYGDLVLSETNLTIESTGCNYPIYVMWNCYLNASNFRIISSGSKYSSVILTGCHIAVGTIQNSVLYGALNEETGLYEASIERDSVYFASQPEKIQKVSIGDEVTVELDVKNFSGQTISYQWYQTDEFREDSFEKAAVKVKNGTEKNLKLTCNEYGIIYYYCVVSAGDIQVYSDLIAVVTGHKGARICTKEISTSATVSEDRLATDGWKWDHTTATLTISDMDYLVPFVGYAPSIYIGQGNTLVVNGTNYIQYNDAKLDFTNTNKYGDGQVSKITGEGKLYLYDFVTNYFPSGSDILMEDVNLQMRLYPGKNGNVILDGATVTTEYSFDVSSGNLVMKNGANLTTGTSVSISGNVTVGEGSVLACETDIDFEGDDFVIEEGGMVVAGGSFTATNGFLNRTLTVNGTLYMKERKTKASFVTFYSKAEESLILGKDVKILYPEGGQWEPKDKSIYGVCVDDDFMIDGLIIGKEKPTFTQISADKNITGTAQAGNSLKAGAVTPKGAEVTYRWEYATTSIGPWIPVDGCTAETMPVTTKYHNYYLRVVINGVGKYIGTVESKPIGPVVGKTDSLAGIYLDCGDAKPQVVDNPFPFDGDDLYRFINSSHRMDGTVGYTVLPVSKDAKVTIRNKTTDFETNGTVADVPMVLGDNEIEIEVKVGSAVKIYGIKHYVYARKYQLSLNTAWWTKPVTLTASWKDANGQEQTLSISGAQQNKYKEIPAGTEVTVTTTCNPLLRVYEYQNLEQLPDYTQEGSPVKFIMDKNKMLILSQNLTAAAAPEGLVAEWYTQQNEAQIAIKAYAVTESTYEPMTVEVFDADGMKVQTISIDGKTAPSADGYYRMLVTGLDATKDYQINAYYPQWITTNVNVPDDLQIARFLLEQRREIKMTPASAHVVLEPGEEINIDINYNGYMGSQVVLEDTFDKTLLSAENTYVKTNDEGKPVLQIKAAEEGEGTTYLLIKGDDHMGEEGMEYVFASIRVDVSGVDEASSLRLGKKSGTLNLYDDSVLTIPVYQMECGHEIEGAEFVDETLNEKFVITVVDDRTIQLVPKVPEDDGSIDYAKWVKSSGNTGTFTSKIRVKYNGASTKESTENLKITLKAKAPEVKVSALSFNSFYTEQTKNLKVTVKGEKVSKVQVDTTKTTATKAACPDWLNVNEVTGEMEFNGNAVPKNKTTATVYLKVWPEGYRIPLQTKVSVKVAYSAPKLKLTNSVFTWEEGVGAGMGSYLYLVSADKKVKDEDIGVKSVRIMNDTEYNSLSAKQRKLYSNPNTLSLGTFNKDAGSVNLAASPTVPAGKMDIYASVKNGKNPVKLTFTIKLTNKPEVKFEKSSVTLDKDLGTSKTEGVKLINSITGRTVDASRISYQVTLSGDKKKADYSEHLSLIYSTYSQKLQVGLTEKTQVGKSYVVKATVKGYEKPMTLTVKVVGGKNIAPTVSKTEINFNRLKADDFSEYKTVILSVPKKYRSDWDLDKVECLKSDGTLDDNTVIYDYALNDETKSITLKLKCSTNANIGTYTLKVYAKHSGGTEFKPATIKVKVTDNVPKMAMTPATVTINKDLPGYDDAISRLSDLSGYYLADEAFTLLSVTDKNGMDATAALTLTPDGMGYRIAANELTEYGATYKVTSRVHFINGVTTDVVTTVKVAKKKAAVTAKGTAKGSLDITRPDMNTAEIKYNYKNWNPADYGVENEPVLVWEIYAKNGKKEITTAQGALNDSGLVASGSSKGCTTEEGSWFKALTQNDYETYSLLKLQINKDSAAYVNQQIAPHYTYTVKAKVQFGALEKTISAPDVTDVVLTVKQGKTKFALNKKDVTLAKLDNKGRDLIIISDKDEDRLRVRNIAYVEVVSDEKVPVSKAIEITPIYHVNEAVIYSVNWKDLNAANVKSGKVKLNVYLEGNNPEWKKPNATLNLTVSVK